MGKVDEFEEREFGKAGWLRFDYPDAEGEGRTLTLNEAQVGHLIVVLGASRAVDFGPHFTWYRKDYVATVDYSRAVLSSLLMDYQTRVNRRERRTSST